MENLADVFTALSKLDGNTLTITSIAISALGAVLSLFIAGLGVWFAIAQYRLKRSTKISASYSITKDIFYHNTYIDSVTIQNLKDKSEAIFGIHLRLGHGCYITLEDLDHKPIILQPFETITKVYDPVSFYGCSSSKVNVNSLLESRKNRVVLTTNKGKYVTKREQKYWSPIGESLHNYAVTALHTVKFSYQTPNGRKITIPDIVQYIVEAPLHGKPRFFYIYRIGRSFSRNKKEFQLEPNMLVNKTTLEKHFSNLNTLEALGIERTSIKVIDVEELDEMKRINDFYIEEDTLDETYSWIAVHILGRLLAKYDNYKLSRINADRYTRSFSYNELLIIKWLPLFFLSALFILAVTFVLF
ncbi:TPA: hypothetical protein I7305_17200 [Vibrio parahaemolyticus]|nr:hypothetical protein [Vibrio parahaemolyticus]HAS6991871.1 hypothetical protein [Vibrio parahaemolyticus]